MDHSDVRKDLLKHNSGGSSSIIPHAGTSHSPPVCFLEGVTRCRHNQHQATTRAKPRLYVLLQQGLKRFKCRWCCSQLTKPGGFDEVEEKVTGICSAIY